jgi:predicted alpha/beta hydrolase family esterase
LNRRDLEIEAAYLFSAWTGLHPDEKFNELNSTFQDQEFYFEKIKGSARKIHQFYSEEDRYVPLEFAKELSENIGSNLHVRAGAGHFNDDSGFKQFP